MGLGDKVRVVSSMVGTFGRVADAAASLQHTVLALPRIPGPHPGDLERVRHHRPPVAEMSRMSGVICVPWNGEELTGRSVTDVMDGDVITLSTTATLDTCCRMVDRDVVRAEIAVSDGELPNNGTNPGNCGFVHHLHQARPFIVSVCWSA